MSLVLSSDASSWLSENGDATEIKTGWLRVRASRLSTSSSDESMVDIPTVLESYQTLRYIGFASGAATTIFETYTAEDQSIELLEFAKGHVRSFPDATAAMDWSSAMDRMGINTDLRNLILDPEYEDVRLSQTARFWVIDALTANYRSLKSLENVVMGSKKKSSKVALQSRIDKSQDPKAE